MYFDKSFENEIGKMMLCDNIYPQNQYVRQYVSGGVHKVVVLLYCTAATLIFLPKNSIDKKTDAFCGIERAYCVQILVNKIH